MFATSKYTPSITLPRAKAYLYVDKYGYSYRFNGKEQENETYGDGNTLDFGARIYDSRLGRFLSVDPLCGSLSDFSPYNFAINNPIIFIDNLGQNPFLATYLLYEGVLFAIEVTGAYIIFNKVNEGTPEFLYASRNQGYDWQRKQDKDASEANRLIEIALAKVISDNFPKNSGEEPNFNNNGKNYNKVAFVFFAATLYVEIKSQLEQQRTEIATKEKVVNEKISILESKGESMTDEEKENLKDLNKKSFDLHQKRISINLAIEKVDKAIEGEKLKQMNTVGGFAPKDNLTTSPLPEPIKPKIKGQ